MKWLQRLRSFPQVDLEPTDLEPTDLEPRECGCLTRMQHSKLAHQPSLEQQLYLSKSWF